MRHLVVLSGAGMSAESGLGTFRDSGGLWEKYKIEEVATPEAWAKNPALVTDFYNMRRKQCIESSPNQGHHILAELENEFDVSIITQNIDNLHERAGSSNVLHLHGEIMKVKSSGPKQEEAYYDWHKSEVSNTDLCPDGYPLRPHVVWFGEAVPALDQAAEIVSRADLFLVVGTSLQVYPAAGLIHYNPLGTPSFIIDPHADEFSLSEFKNIAKPVTEGMAIFKEIIKNY
ncbi:NAD-dependent deacetylase [Lishizhenia tianjinensis]|uniref:NAD-dependent protein deacylase n=1 Tax=Lishizhenia tianjinensis TaxID=477690 RepID=A0A1I7B124_9FLAO|nr:Sir2 family NAD-dependent protein deacetylase [Lishizhenia tianjinensis]SFT80900.1 NAD-dependent deacetylase [Lishizhenia tianjinensis]